MKKIVLIKNDDGTLELDGQPVESPEDALEQIKMSVMPEGGAGESSGEMPGMGDISGEKPMMDDEMPMMDGKMSDMPDEEPMESDDIGKTLGDKMPMVDKEKRGMRPKKKASFEDYGI